MREALIAVMIFLCLTAAPLVSMAIWPRLPARHRDDDTNNVVRLAANLFGVMTSLVLGLMINSAKNTFELIDHNVHDYATELILLDRTLREYGPETDAARQPLVVYVQRVAGDAASDRRNAGRRQPAVRTSADGDRHPAEGAGAGRRGARLPSAGWPVSACRKWWSCDGF